ncbi:hypothetical protein [Planctomyces sp. SH-PL62]|uniref:hypothetical protein n=1 Tax=Planctomyces sp. SH-PL62 TaxID=1636152 RepID=UPI00078DBFE0|nr:hypothetical protein [Planctomyces sp. SH-PL62]AMV39523.1 hypothetical protein VT85_18950 [Planctomyces sp. SH-PL62]
MTTATPSRVSCLLALPLVILAMGLGSAKGDSVFDVAIDGKSLGQFAVNVYHGEATDTPSGLVRGAAIQGVFTPGGALGLPAGYEYRWIQTVTSTDPAYQVSDSWQKPDVTYIDRTRLADGKTVGDGSPFYVNRYDPISGTLPFQDNPARLVESFSGVWNLTLVAVEGPSNPLAPFDTANSSDDRDIFAITSFVWGFSYNLGATAVTLRDLAQQAVDLDALSEAFARDVAFGDASTFSPSAWTLRQGFPTTVVPEPSSLTLLLFPPLLYLAAIPRGRRRSRSGA